MPGMTDGGTRLASSCADGIRCQQLPISPIRVEGNGHRKETLFVELEAQKIKTQSLVSFPPAPPEQRRGSVRVNQAWRRTPPSPRYRPGLSHHGVDSLPALLQLFNVAVDVNIAHRRRLCVAETASRAASRRKCVIEARFFSFRPEFTSCVFFFFFVHKETPDAKLGEVGRGNQR